MRIIIKHFTLFPPLTSLKNTIPKHSSNSRTSERLFCTFSVSLSLIHPSNCIMRGIEETQKNKKKKEEKTLAVSLPTEKEAILSHESTVKLVQCTNNQPKTE